MDRGIFNLPRHTFNFIRGIIAGIVSPVLNASERDRRKGRDGAVIGEPMKAVSAVRRLECNVHARFGHDGVKVVSNWVLHRAGAWLRRFSVPEEELPHSHLGASSPNRPFSEIEVSAISLTLARKSSGSVRGV